MGPIFISYLYIQAPTNGHGRLSTINRQPGLWRVSTVDLLSSWLTSINHHPGLWWVSKYDIQQLTTTHGRGRFAHQLIILFDIMILNPYKWHKGHTYWLYDATFKLFDLQFQLISFNTIILLRISFHPQDDYFTLISIDTHTVVIISV